jgi:hypothetical protein
MAFSTGARIGAFEVIARIGEGGMGEVYKATDINLKWAVAIKVLPTSVAADPERLARFQREAELLAALNHPNIAQIHGLENSAGATALVMELVEGPTLADRIAHRQGTRCGRGFSRSRALIAPWIVPSRAVPRMVAGVTPARSVITHVRPHFHVPMQVTFTSQG